MCRLTQCIIMTLAAFISGAVMYSYLIPLVLFRVNIVKISADKNPGCSNVIRSVGLVTGIVCMVLDVLKAFLPVFIAVKFIGLSGFYLVPVAAAPVLGHAFSPMLKFKGGKAVSTAYGVLLGLLPLTIFVIVPALFMAFFRFVVVIRPDSYGVAVSMAGVSAFALIFVPELWLKAIVITISAVMIYKLLKHPDKGTFSIGTLHHIVKIEDKRLVFVKYET
ncbi:glycerol-3-phosphate acyltransferase [[Clostridium] cellulosi]